MSTFHADNEWGVPTLREDMQATVAHPVLPWGSRARGAVMRGTWVFYVDDYRFTSLEKQPLQLAATSCTGAVELNFTVLDHASRAEALWATYRKRRVAREWQDAGIPVLVDLNVPTSMLELCTLGVPRSWRSFATRGYAARPESLRAEWGFARARAGNGLLLLVYGGGPTIETMCHELAGCVYAPSHWEARGEG